jgi:SpoU rRNA methylase family enzyme
MRDNLFVAIHNVTSIQKLQEFVQVLLGFQIKTIIISKAIGSAAISGVPRAQKLIFKKGGNLLYTEDIPDCIELLSPDEVYVIAPQPYSKNKLEPKSIAQELKNNKKLLLVFGGSNPGLSKRELEFGIDSYLEVPSDIGTIGTAAIILHQIFREL